MKDISEFLGWVVVIGYFLALCNYILKYINKKYINVKLKDNKNIVNNYRMIMKYIIKYHKLIGIIISCVIFIHFAIMLYVKGLSITGIIALLTMVLTTLLGIYGAYFKKKYGGSWLYVHRTLAFILFIMIIIHII